MSNHLTHSSQLKLEEAVALHQQGQLAQAKAVYEDILRAEPQHENALYLLGIVAAQTQHYQQAIELIEKAIAVNPARADFYASHGLARQELRQFTEALASYDRAIRINPDIAETYLNRGDTLKELKQLEKAVESYDRAIALKADYVEAYSNRGDALQELKQFKKAIESYDHAIHISPDIAEIHCNRGNALQELTQFEKAVESYDRAITIKPDYAAAHYNRGLALQALKQFEKAVASYDRAIAINPDYAEAYSNRGLVLQELKQLDAAIKNYDQAIGIKPGIVEAHYNRGNALQELNQFEKAVESYDRAIVLRPDDAKIYYNRGNALKELKQFEEAVASYDRAIKIKSDYAEAYSNRGNALRELHRLEEALPSYNRAIAINPDFAEAHYNLGNVLRELKQFEEAIASYSRAVSIKPDIDYLFGILLHTKMHLCDWADFDKNIDELVKRIERNEKSSFTFPTLALIASSSLQRQASAIWVNDKRPVNHSLGDIPKHPRTEKIKVAYFSADFHFHPVSILLVELFERLDKNRFELIAFSFGPDVQDEMRQRVQHAFGHFIDARNKSDKEVAELARQMNVDIAIDLGGDTTNSRAPNIFVYRAAPIQVNYLGYPGTMGAEYFDYIIADKTIVPVESRPYYAEKIVYLPSYQPSDSQRPISEKIFTRQELGLPDEGFAFCCLHNTYKITPAIFDGWMRILKAVKGSVLFLYADHKKAEENLKKEAVARGVDSSRLVFAARLKERGDYLARYKTFDLFLDAFPYNAQATANDVLWAGLPLVTRAGEAFASRVAASLLTAIGLPELITTTQAGYEALAIELATHPAKLSAIKAKLTANRLTTPLFNTARYTQHMEAAYTQMVERYQSDLPPDHIYVE